MNDREYRKFDPTLPLGEANRPPYTWYIDQETQDDEKEAIFQSSWICVGRSDQLEKPGDYFTGDIMGNPYVVLLDENKKLRAFHNVCRHLGHEVASEHGNSCELTCSYHGWTYKLDGSIKAMPHMGAFCFDVKRVGLKKMSVAQWGPFIFVDMDGSWTEDDKDIRNLNEDFDPVFKVLEEMGMSHMKHVERRVYDIKCNWKVFVDNGLDGGYHVAYAHERLAEGLEFEGYQTHIKPRCSYQVCDTNKMDSRLGDKVIYAWLFPNLFINRYGRCMDTNIVMPVTPNSCRVYIDWYFDYDNLEDWTTQKKFKRAIGDSHVVQKEDIAVCESVQRGMNSMSFEHGHYSVKLEAAVHAFHILLWKEFKNKKG